MVDYQRLAKEDYELLGRCHSWTTWDAKVMLASFEMESAGEFGDTQELFRFNVPADVDLLEGVEKTFHEKWSKWDAYIFPKMLSRKLPYANTPSVDAPDSPVDIVCEDLDCCNISPKELIKCISADIKAEELSLDLNLLIEFLRGNSNAPSRMITKSQKEALSEACRENAQKCHDADKPKHDALWQFLMDDLAGGCTCTKRQACDRIYRVRYRNDETYLKAQTGYKKLEFTRRVSEALIAIEKRDKTGINRHENTEGFKIKNVPPCTKHPKQ